MADSMADASADNTADIETTVLSAEGKSKGGS
jgi:hypothetical protein